MAGIVESIFGPTPEQVRQAQQSQIEQRAAAYAGQTPVERYRQGLYQTGADIGTIGAGMLGMEPKAVTEARQREAMLSQIDFSTPEGILKGAELARQRGDVRTQLGLQQLAVQRQKEMQGESPFAKINPKDYTPESLAKFAVTKKLSDLVAAPKAAGGGIPSPIAEYNLAVEQGYKGTYEEWKSKWKKTQGEGESAPIKISTQDQIRMKKSDEVASAASQSRQLLESYNALLDSYAGKLGAGETIYGGGARVAATLGFEQAEKRAADYETLDAWTKELGAKSLQMFGGSDTEKELDIAIRTNPDPNKRIESNKRIIAQKLAAIEVMERKPDFESEWIAKNGSLGALDRETRKSFSAAWRQYQRDNFKPFSPVETQTATKRPTQSPQAGGVPPLPAGFTPL